MCRVQSDGRFILSLPCFIISEYLNTWKLFVFCFISGVAIFPACLRTPSHPCVSKVFLLHDNINNMQSAFMETECEKVHLMRLWLVCDVQIHLSSR